MTHAVTILSFCAGCGALLPAQDACVDGDKCPNCHHVISDKSQRIEGEFPLDEANKLSTLIHGVPVHA